MRSLSSTAEQLGPNLLPSTLATGAYGVFLLPPSMATRPQLQREETVLHLFTFPVQAGKEKKGEKKRARHHPSFLFTCTATVVI